MSLEYLRVKSKQVDRVVDHIKQRRVLDKAINDIPDHVPKPEADELPALTVETVLRHGFTQLPGGLAAGESEKSYSERYSASQTHAQSAPEE